MFKKLKKYVAIHKIKSLKALPEADKLDEMISDAEGSIEDQVGRMNKDAIFRLVCKLKNYGGCSSIGICTDGYNAQAVKLFKEQLDGLKYSYEDFEKAHVITINL